MKEATSQGEFNKIATKEVKDINDLMVRVLYVENEAIMLELLV